MAKISFNKLGLTKDSIQPRVLNWNDVDIEIKQYLPIQEKLELLSKVINQATASDSKIYNPGQLSLFFKLEIIYAYTNISFTDKQKENFTKTFDMLESSGLIKAIMDTIPVTEIDTLTEWLIQSARSVYQYANSARAILESLQTDYNNLNFDIESLQEKIKDPDSLNILKEIAPMLDLG